MATITIAYTAVTAPANQVGAQICSTYLPTSAAADLAPFDGTYYDTNVQGFGEVMPVSKFYADSVAHPGVVLALKLAVEKGSYAFETTEAKEIAYFEELADALASQGFTITVDKE